MPLSGTASEWADFQGFSAGHACCLNGRAMADPISADNSAPAEPASEISLSPGPTRSPEAAPATPPPPSTEKRKKSLSLLVALVVLAVTGLGSLMFVASAMRAPEAERAAAAPAATTAGDRAVAPAPVAVKTAAEQPAIERQDAIAIARPKWQANANPRKAGVGARMFELSADGDIDVWRKRVRPVLTVRCARRAIEVFVVTNSPAAIEGNSRNHTVKLSFDGREPVESMWEHSVDHDALFAPNGGAMLRQIAGARTMSFTFAPFNAPPATVSFNIEGFDAHRKSARRLCGAELTSADTKGRASRAASTATARRNDRRANRASR